MSPAAPARSIRVLLDAMPALLHDVVAGALADAPGIAFADAPAGVAIADAARTARADVVIVTGEPGRAPAVMDALLSECPSASVVVVVDAVEADALVRYELWPRAEDLGEPTAERLVGALRGATPWAERFDTPTGLAP